MGRNKFLIYFGIFFIITNVIFSQTPGTLKWKFKTRDQIKSSPAIDNDGTIYIGSADSNLYAINPDGTKKWAAKTGGAIYSSPVIGSNGTIYIIADNNKLYALSSTGQIKWTYNVSMIYNIAPAIDGNDNIYVTYNRILHKVDKNGVCKWKYDLKGSFSDDILHSPVIGIDGSIYIVTGANAGEGGLYSLDENGNLKWVFRMGNPYIPYPNEQALSLTIDKDGTIYFIANTGYYSTMGIYALNPDGTKKWFHDTYHYPLYSSISTGSSGKLYYCSYDYALHCLNHDGSESWTHPINKVHSASTVGNDGVIYFGSTDGNFYAVSSEGKECWTYLVQGGIYSSPAIDKNKTIYFGGTGGYLYAINCSSNGYADDLCPKFRMDNKNSGNASYKNVPVPVFKSDSLNCNVGETIKLDASQSYDPNNEPLQYKWKLMNTVLNKQDVIMPDSTSSIINISCNTHGIFKFLLSLKNSKAMVSKMVTVYSGIQKEIYPGGTISTEFAQDKNGNLYYGTKDAYFYAMDKSYNIKWKYENANGYFYSYPVVGSNGNIYALNTNGYLYSFDPAGNKRWAYCIENNNNYANMAIGSGSVIYLVNKNLYAINPDGTKKWEFSEKDSYKETNFSSIPPVIGNDGTIFINSSDTLYAINPDGTKKWKFNTGECPGKRLIGRDGILYLISSQYLLAVNPDGTLKWKTSIASENINVQNAIIGKDDRIYLFDSNKFIAVNNNGQVEFNLNRDLYQTIFPLASDDNKIYLFLKNDFWGINGIYIFNSDGTKNSNIYIQDGANFIIDQNGNLCIVTPEAIYVLNKSVKIADSPWPLIRKDFSNTSSTYNPDFPVAKVKNIFFNIAVTQPFILDGSDSYSPAGHSLTYKWECIERPGGSKVSIINPYNPVTRVETDSAGTYRFKYSVKDNLNRTAFQNVIVKSGIKWAYGYDDEFYGCPAIGNDSSIYITSYNDFTALSPDGKEKWSYPLNNYCSQALIDKNYNIYFANGNKLYSFDKYGKNQWEYQLPGILCGSAATGAQNNICIASEVYLNNRWNLYSLKDGSEKWINSFESKLILSPAVGMDGTVYTGTEDGKLYAVNKNGIMKWEHDFGYEIFSYSSISKTGVLYVTTYNTLYAIRADGSILWKFSPSDKITSTPLINMNGTIYFGTKDCKLFAVNPDGTKKWQFNFSNSVENSVVIGTDGNIYAGSGNMIYAISKEGMLIWSIKINGWLSKPFNINSDGSLLFGAYGRLYSLQTTSKGINNDTWSAAGKDQWNSRSMYTDDCPFANVACKSINVSINEEFILDAGSSTSPGNQKLNFEWTCLKKPEGASYYLSDSLSSSVKAHVSGAGAYVFSVKVFNPINPSLFSFETIEVISGLKWQKQFNFERVATPAIDPSGIVIFGNDRSIYAVNNKGESVWSYENYYLGSLHSPVAISPDGNIYTVSYNSGNLICLDLQGKELWHNLIDFWGETCPAFGNSGSVYVPSNAGHIDSYDQNGNKKWSTKINLHYDSDSSPICGPDGIIYIGSSDSCVYAINPDGSIKWTFNAGGAFSTTPALDKEGTIYIGSLNSFFYAISKDGELKWKFQADDGITAPPVIDNNNNICFGTYYGKFYSLTKAGDLNWKYDAKQQIKYSPLIGNDNIIYFPSFDKLNAIDSKGNLKWSYAVDGYISTHLVISNEGVIYLGTSSGSFCAVQTSCTGLANTEWPKYHFDNQNSCGYTRTSVNGNKDYKLKLCSNYPNPFNATTNIEFEIPKRGNVSIEIYNLLGQVVRKLTDQEYNAGNYILRWNGTNDTGMLVSSGTYFLRMQYNDFVQVSKMLCIK